MDTKAALTSALDLLGELDFDLKTASKNGDDDSLQRIEDRRQELALTADALRQLADAAGHTQVWAVLFSHRHGDDVWLRFGERPTEKSEIAQLKKRGDWDGPDRGDFLEIFGPFPLPAAPAAKPRAQRRAAAGM
jgi:hypothetical protein